MNESHKDYLSCENKRNRLSHPVFERLIKAATGAVDVLVVHHLTFTVEGSEPNEIPSADTLIFDHDLMSKVFPTTYVQIMQTLAAAPCESRDTLLEHFLDSHAEVAVPATELQENQYFQPALQRA